MKLLNELDLDSHEANEMVHHGFILVLIRMGSVKDHYRVYEKGE